jgi:hypothetical protein
LKGNENNMGKHGGQAFAPEAGFNNMETNVFDDARTLVVPLADTNFLLQGDVEVPDPLSVVSGEQVIPLPPGMLLHDGRSELAPHLPGSGTELENVDLPKIVGYVRQNGTAHLFTPEDVAKENTELPRVVVKRISRLLGENYGLPDDLMTESAAATPRDFIATNQLTDIMRMHALEIRNAAEDKRFLAIIEESNAMADELATAAYKGFLARAAVTASSRARDQADAQQRQREQNQFN